MMPNRSDMPYASMTEGRRRRRRYSTGLFEVLEVLFNIFVYRLSSLLSSLSQSFWFAPLNLKIGKEVHQKCRNAVTKKQRAISRQKS
jgi:hypothetical protein